MSPWASRTSTATEPEAFAQWLADQTGETVIGGPVNEAPTVVAVPDA